MHIRLTPAYKDGSCFLCNAHGQVITFFIQVDNKHETHVADTWEVCLQCLLKHHIAIVGQELETSPKKRTPKTDKRASMRQEQKLADAVGGVRQRGSGALPWARGDVRKKGELRGEAKQTRGKQYILKRSELEKIRAEASFDEDPFLAVWFCDKNWKPEDKWVLVPQEVWEKLRNG